MANSVIGMIGHIAVSAGITKKTIKYIEIYGLN